MIAGERSSCSRETALPVSLQVSPVRVSRCWQSDVFCAPSPALLTPHLMPRAVQLPQPRTFRAGMAVLPFSCARAFFLCPRVYTPRSLPRRVGASAVWKPEGVSMP